MKPEVIKFLTELGIATNPHNGDLFVNVEGMNSVSNPDEILSELRSSFGKGYYWKEKCMNWFILGNLY